MNSIEYSIVIPCYNEEDNLEILFNSIQPLSNENLQIIIVDNGSTDNSSKILKILSQKIPIQNLKIISVRKNLGYGGGIIKGLNQADGAFLGWTHADLQTDINDIITGFNLIKDYPEKTIIKGKRTNRGIFDTIFTALMSIICTVILKKSFSDINAQPKIFRQSFYLQIREGAPTDFSLDLYLLFIAKKLKYTIIDFPVFFNKRLHGEAKGGGSIKTKLKLSIRTFSYILDIYRNEK
jgi:glycosyltransferase involved in cell wall biosynthesis